MNIPHHPSLASLDPEIFDVDAWDSMTMTERENELENIWDRPDPEGCFAFAMALHHAPLYCLPNLQLWGKRLGYTMNAELLGFIIEKMEQQKYSNSNAPLLWSAQTSSGQQTTIWRRFIHGVALRMEEDPQAPDPAPVFDLLDQVVPPAAVGTHPFFDQMMIDMEAGQPRQALYWFGLLLKRESLWENPTQECTKTHPHQDPAVVLLWAAILDDAIRDAQVEEFIDMVQQWDEASLALEHMFPKPSKPYPQLHAYLAAQEQRKVLVEATSPLLSKQRCKKI